MKKRILFAAFRMDIGGVERAMLALMNALDPDKFEIHLALLCPEGDLMKEIPPHVQVHPISGFSDRADLVLTPKKSIPRRILKGDFKTGLPALYHYLLAQSQKSLATYSDWLLKGRRQDFDEEFDLAIDFPGFPGEYLGFFVTRHVNARRRAQWVHFDLSRVYFRPKSMAQIGQRVDAVFCVSEQAMLQYRQFSPENAEKAVVFHNIIDNERILKQSRAETIDRGRGINIVTIGRTAFEKGQDIALHALKKLNASGPRYFWHFVGGGAQLESFKALAEELGVSDCCRFYGALNNPYPMLSIADLYVQPSRHEGFCITLGEAKVLGLPIIAPDFKGSREQLDGVPNCRVIEEFHPGTEVVQADVDALVDAISTADLSKISPDSVAAKNDEFDRFLSLFE